MGGKGSFKRKKGAILMSTREGRAKGQDFDNRREDGFEGLYIIADATVRFPELIKMENQYRQEIRIFSRGVGLTRGNRGIQSSFSMTRRSSLQNSISIAAPSPSRMSAARRASDLSSSSLS